MVMKSGNAPNAKQCTIFGLENLFGWLMLKLMIKDFNCVNFRVGYVFMDPVIACLTITPVMTLSRLPKVLDLYHCLENMTTVTNTTIECLDNDTAASVLVSHQEKDHLMEQQVMILYVCFF